MTAVYQVSDLGMSGGTGSAARAINEAGDIIGTLGTGTSAEFSPQANPSFLWHDSQVTDFGRSYAVFAMNNSGQLAGTKYLPGFGADFSLSKVSPALYENGKWKSILPQGAVSGMVVGLNDRGQAAGQLCLDASQPNKLSAAVWQGNDVRLLEVLEPYTSAVVKAINATGEAVGYLQEVVSETRYRTSAVFWGKNGTTLLGSLPETDQSEAVAINNNGCILGVTTFGMAELAKYAQDQMEGEPPSMLPILSFGGFLWDGGRATALVGANENAPGIDLAKGYVARAVNDNAQVVGRATDLTGNLVAFLWQNNRMVNLNTSIPTESGWTLVDAKGLNNQGQIVGLGKHDGQSYAFLLTPL